MKKLIILILLTAALTAHSQITNCNGCDTLPTGATPAMLLNQVERANNLNYALLCAKTALNDSLKFDSIVFTYNTLLVSYLVGSDSLPRKLRSDAAHTTGIKQKVLNTIIKNLTSF
jgi:hypothetical protein